MLPVWREWRGVEAGAARRLDVSCDAPSSGSPSRPPPPPPWGRCRPAEEAAPTASRSRRRTGAGADVVAALGGRGGAAAARARAPQGAALVVRGADGTRSWFGSTPASQCSPCGAERAAEEGDGGDGDGDTSRTARSRWRRARGDGAAPAVGGAYAARPLLALRGAGDAPAAGAAARGRALVLLAPGAVPSVEVAEVGPLSLCTP